MPIGQCYLIKKMVNDSCKYTSEESFFLQDILSIPEKERSITHYSIGGMKSIPLNYFQIIATLPNYLEKLVVDFATARLAPQMWEEFERIVVKCDDHVFLVRSPSDVDHVSKCCWRWLRSSHPKFLPPMDGSYYVLSQRRVEPVVYVRVVVLYTAPRWTTVLELDSGKIYSVDNISSLFFPLPEELKFRIPIVKAKAKFWKLTRKEFEQSSPRKLFIEDYDFVNDVPILNATPFAVKLRSKSMSDIESHFTSDTESQFKYEINKSVDPFIHENFPEFSDEVKAVEQRIGKHENANTIAGEQQKLIEKDTDANTTFNNTEDRRLIVIDIDWKPTFIQEYRGEDFWNR
ncbi:unnamed protein product [Caenorhabditis bovis]|uniref:Uncharacterized protein n=1 Tax=Caenorhabditis bovis TaxID=2654633 RepID=A0A8S1ETE6_9PELO|nr:unnamed protein product [Caenorhabditis bovis]